MLNLNTHVAEAIAKQVNEGFKHGGINPDEVKDLASESTEFTKFIDLVQVCILYTSVFASTPDTNTIAGITFCVFCGEQIQVCNCIDEP